MYLDGNGSMFIVEWPAMASPTSLCPLPLPSSLWTPPLLRTFLFLTRNKKVNQGTWCHVACRATWLGRLDRSVMLKLRGHFQGSMDSGYLNCAEKDISFMASWTVFIGNHASVLSCGYVYVVIWYAIRRTLKLHSPLRYMIQNLLMQHWGYAPCIAGPYLFNSFCLNDLNSLGETLKVWHPNDFWLGVNVSIFNSFHIPYCDIFW